MPVDYEERASVRRAALHADLVNMAGHLVPDITDDDIRINRHDMATVRADILERILNAALDLQYRAIFPVK
jgi:hypothetical protein